MTIRKLAVSLSLACALASPAGAAPPSLPYAFSPGTPARAAEVNANFQALAAGIAEAVPPGTLLPYAGTSAPAGFLLCNGAAVSRATYVALFAVVGERFGRGDGSSTFNVPDLRGMFVRGTVGLTETTVSSISTGTGTLITQTEHGLNRSGFPIRFKTSGSLPSPLAVGTTYWAIYDGPSSLKVASSEANALAGVALTLSGGTGTQVVVPWADPDATTRSASGPGGATGDSVGSKQEHALQDLEGDVTLRKAGEGVTSKSGVFAGTTVGQETVAGHTGTATFDASPTLRFDASLVANTSSETRPRNVGVSWIIRY